MSSREKTNNVIKMGMSDEDKILVNSSGGAPPNIKSTLKLWYNYTSLLASNGQTLNCIPSQVNSFTDNSSTGLSVVFFFLNSTPDFW